MSDRKEEIAWLERIERDLWRKNDLCPGCNERPAKEETELCERCELFSNYEQALEGKQ